MKRRLNGEGSITHRKDGRWYARIVTGGVLRHHYARSQAECRRWLLDVRRQDGRAVLSQGGRVSLGDYLDWWLMQVQPQLRGRTWATYAGLCRLHILPALGSVPLGDLRPGHLQALYTQLQHEGRATPTGKAVHAVLHRALSQATRWELIGRNPADLVDAPRPARPNRQSLTLEQTLRFLAVAREHNWASLWLLAIQTGMRQGELLGLRWGDVDLERGVIQVQRQLYRGRGSEHGLVFREVKSARSRRAVALGPGMVARLRAERDGAGGPDDLLFRSRVGTPLEPRSVVRAFKMLLRRAGLPGGVHFHDLRHTSASLMADEGVHPNVVQSRLGHTDVTLTLGVYTHLAERAQHEAATALERATGVDGK